MRFEFLSQFRKVRNAFECFVTQVQTRLPKTKCVWPMKINVICTVHKIDSGLVRLMTIAHAFNYRVAVLRDGVRSAVQVGRS